MEVTNNFKGLDLIARVPEELWTEVHLEKTEEPEIKLPTSTGSLKEQENSIKTSTFYFTDNAKAFDCVDHNKR